LCWHCDNLLRDQQSSALALANCAAYILTAVRRELGFDDTHALTLPELCWWLARNGLADAIPETAARQMLRLPKPVIQSVTRESDLVPTRGPSEIVQETAARVLASLSTLKHQMFICANKVAVGPGKTPHSVGKDTTMYCMR
jgi:hypothetical protein